MTPVEFNEWFADYCRSFPETADWANGLPDKEGTLTKWRVIFAAKRIDLVFGKRVTAEMLAGDLPAVAAYEREKTPAVVVAGGRELRRREGGDRYRSESDIAATTKRSTAKYVRPEGAISAWQMAEQYRLMRSQGTSKAECDRWLDEADRKAYPQ